MFYVAGRGQLKCGFRDPLRELSMRLLPRVLLFILMFGQNMSMCLSSAIRCSCLSIAFFLAFCAILAECRVAQAKPGDAAVMSSVAEGYTANRASFVFASCTYEVTKGTADSIQEALAGKIELRERLEGIWAYDAGKERCSLVNSKVPRVDDTNEEVVVEKPSTAGAGPSLVSTASEPSSHFLGDVTQQITFSPDIGVANLFSIKNREKNPGITPWNMGVMGPNEKNNPGKLVLEFVQTKKSIELTEGEVDGTPVLAIKLTDHDKRQLTFSFDPEGGFLPIHIDFFGKSELFITDVKECTGNRFFPMRSCELTPNKKTGKVNVREIRVTTLDVDSKPDEDLFALQLPSGTRVINLSRKSERFVLDEDVRVPLSEISTFTRNQGGPE